MSEIIDLKKEKNFFETRVTEYQTGAHWFGMMRNKSKLIECYDKGKEIGLLSTDQFIYKDKDSWYTN